MRKRISTYIIVTLYLIIIVFITIIKRPPGLMRGNVNSILFQSWYTQNSKQFLLNIALFIPLGYLLGKDAKRKWILVFLALLISITIETIQYYTGRGWFDVDDLVSNTIGATIGILLSFLCREWKWRSLFSYFLFIIGLIGCIIAVKLPSFQVNYTRQFDFHVSDIQIIDNRVQLIGNCAIYGRATPHYDLFLDNRKTNTKIDGDQFVAADVKRDGKFEIFVQFEGYDPISTGSFLIISSDGEVNIEYIPGKIDIPFSVPDYYILKAFIPEQQTYVFQDNNRLVWYIGWEITPSTEVIYQLHTNEPEKLPQNRIRYKYDNRGFRVTKDNKNELNQVGIYRVFEELLPDTYNVTAVMVGYNISGIITGIQYFRVE